jgi:hypothetical protein
MSWVRHVASMGPVRDAYRIAVASLKERDHKEHGWEDNIKMDLREIRLEDGVRSI